MNLQTLKNIYAQEQGYEDWDSIKRKPGYVVEMHMDRNLHPCAESSFGKGSGIF